MYLRNLMILGWVTTIFVSPFAIYSFTQQRYLIAAIAIIIVIVSSINSHHIKNKRDIAIPYVYWYLVIVTVLVLLTMKIGINGLLWSYPFVLSTYFVQERHLARKYCLITYVSFVIACYISSEPALVFRFAVTFFMLILLTDVSVGELMRLERKLMEQTIRDPLTNAHNRRYMDYVLDLTIEEINRNYGPASLISLDIDHFKKVNDKHGHIKGDDVLIKLVDLLHNRQRKLDYVFRSGGEEFVLLFRNTGLQQAISLAESLRQSIEDTEFLQGETITVSLGVAEYQTSETKEEWLSRSDELLYQAKDEGRNCVRPAVLDELYD